MATSTPKCYTTVQYVFALNDRSYCLTAKGHLSIRPKQSVNLFDTFSFCRNNHRIVYITMGRHLKTHPFHYDKNVIPRPLLCSILCNLATSRRKTHRERTSPEAVVLVFVDVMGLSCGED